MPTSSRGEGESFPKNSCRVLGSQMAAGQISTELPHKTREVHCESVIFSMDPFVSGRIVISMEVSISIRDILFRAKFVDPDLASVL